MGYSPAVWKIVIPVAIHLLRFLVNSTRDEKKKISIQKTWWKKHSNFRRHPFLLIHQWWLHRYHRRWTRKYICKDCTQWLSKPAVCGLLSPRDTWCPVHPWHSCKWPRDTWCPMHPWHSCKWPERSQSVAWGQNCCGRLWWRLNKPWGEERHGCFVEEGKWNEKKLCYFS